MGQAAPGFKKHPDHIVYITALPGTYIQSFGDVEIARSTQVLEVTESRHMTRLYFPVQDIDLSCLEEADHMSYCPFKGEARYWTVKGGALSLQDGAWAYDDPYEECVTLKDHICFYAEKDGFSLKKEG
ncbi:MAG: DUF427 domain-containing protein [Sneathiella sp.]